MTLNLAALYLCAIAAVTMLGLFARHNRKTGWVKQRKTFVSDLLALQAAWDEIDHAVAGAVQLKASPTAIQPITVQAQAGFSLQLANMGRALGHSTVHPAAKSHTEKGEKVLV